MTREQVVTRPPQSTQQLGQCFLDAYQLTGKKIFLGESIRSARALACTQRGNGRWNVAGLIPTGCMGGSEISLITENPAGESENPGALKTAVEFSQNLAAALEESSLVAPQWLLEMTSKATQALEGMPVAPVKSLGNYIDQSTQADTFVYSREDLIKNNPDGFQTTEDLVNQCYAMIRNLVSI